MAEVRKQVTFNNTNEQDSKRLEIVNELVAAKKWGRWVKDQLDFEIKRREMRSKVMQHTTPEADK